jgi:hypothetical protein
MKHFIQFAVLVALLGLGACGKDNKSGNGGSGSNFNPINAGNLPQDNAQALQQLQAWYNSTTEPQMNGAYRLTHVASNSSSNNGNCTEKPIIIFGVTVGHYTVCSGGSGSSSGTQTQCGLNIFPSTANVKANNIALAQIMSGQLGELVHITKQNTLYTLQIRKTNNHVKVYLIDTALHSSMQPVQVNDSETGNMKFLASWSMTSISGLSICNMSNML